MALAQREYVLAAPGRVRDVEPDETAIEKCYQWKHGGEGAAGV
jgi:hypothetical protein